MGSSAPKFEVKYTIEAEFEHERVRGNALASGNDAEDKKAEDEILARLENGDRWAWCCVRVTASVKTESGLVYEGSDYLGCCSYDSEEGFKNGGYYEDMKEKALNNLCLNLERVRREGVEAGKALEAIYKKG